MVLPIDEIDGKSLKTFYYKCKTTKVHHNAH